MKEWLYVLRFIQRSLSWRPAGRNWNSVCNGWELSARMALVLLITFLLNSSASVHCSTPRILLLTCITLRSAFFLTWCWGCKTSRGAKRSAQIQYMIHKIRSSMMYWSETPAVLQGNHRFAENINEKNSIMWLKKTVRSPMTTLEDPQIFKGWRNWQLAVVHSTCLVW